MAAYVRKLIQTCHRRGVHAMGGMAAQVNRDALREFSPGLRGADPHQRRREGAVGGACQCQHIRSFANSREYRHTAPPSSGA
jgi:hypothetical protein